MVKLKWNQLGKPKRNLMAKLRGISWGNLEEPVREIEEQPVGETGEDLVGETEGNQLGKLGESSWGN